MRAILLFVLHFVLAVGGSCNSESGLDSSASEQFAVSDTVSYVYEASVLGALYRLESTRACFIEISRWDNFELSNRSVLNLAYELDNHVRNSIIASCLPLAPYEDLSPLVSHYELWRAVVSGYSMEEVLSAGLEILEQDHDLQRDEWGFDAETSIFVIVGSASTNRLIVLLNDLIDHTYSMDHNSRLLYVSYLIQAIDASER